MWRSERTQEPRASVAAEHLANKPPSLPGGQEGGKGPSGAGDTRGRLRRRLCAAVFLFLPMVAAAAPPAGSLSLTEVVLFGLRPPHELVPARYRREGRPCVQAYLKAVSHDRQLRSWKAPVGPERAVPARRRNLEAQIVLLLGEPARSEGKRFAGAVPLQAEWEGASEGPLDEAELARQWLERDPDTSLGPFLHLFMAHRFRAAHEASVRENAKELSPIVARRYREHLAAARGASNALIACLADDLQAQPHVYLPGLGRP